MGRPAIILSFILHCPILIVIGLLFIVRRVNANAEAERRGTSKLKNRHKTELDREQNDEHDRLDNK